MISLKKSIFPFFIYGTTVCAVWLFRPVPFLCRCPATVFHISSVIRFLGCNIVAGMNRSSHLLPACRCPSHIVLSADTRRVERPHPCNMSSGWKQSVVKEVSGRDAMWPCPITICRQPSRIYRKITVPLRA